MVNILLKYKPNKKFYIKLCIERDLKPFTNYGQHTKDLSVCNVYDPEHKLYPISKDVWASICLSGMLYALGKAKSDYWNLSIKSIEACIDDNDLNQHEGFACAGVMAVFIALERKELLEQEDYKGWILESTVGEK